MLYTDWKQLTDRGTLKPRSRQLEEVDAALLRFNQTDLESDLNTLAAALDRCKNSKENDWKATIRNQPTMSARKGEQVNPVEALSGWIDKRRQRFQDDQRDVIPALREAARTVLTKYQNVIFRNRTAANLLNPYDVVPTWQEGALGRPHRFEETGVYELPFGGGRRFLHSGLPSRLIGGFQLSTSYEWQPGPLVNFGTNLFYSGDLSAIAGSSHTPSQWFNTSGFQRTASLGPQQYQSRVFPLVVSNVRSDMANFWNANLQRDFRLREGVALQLRAEALNLFNRSQFAAPGTNPYSTAFGTVSSTSATYNRFFQLLVRLRF